MPAEWAPHAGTWLVWPHAADDFPGRFEAVPFAFAEIVRHLVPHEPVRIVVGSERREAAARALLEHAGVELERVRFFRWTTDRSWVRDSGPIFVRRPGDATTPASVGATAWGFTAWAKYDNFARDARLGARIGRALGVPTWRPRQDDKPLVLEGGAIDVNGAGALLATEECLLSSTQARNPGLGRAELEAIFAEYLGVERVVWLARGIVGDDTHGHIDDVARFVNERTVAVAREPRTDDPNHAPLEENLERLRGARDADGRPFEVVELPMPSPIVYSGQRVPASYLNFYIANEAVLVPTFNDPADRVALDALASAFPDRTVRGIHSGDLIWGLGSVHCLTQQEPAA